MFICLQISTDNLLLEKLPEFDLTENPEPELPAKSDPPRTPESLIPEGDSEPTEEPSSATPDSDAKTLSSSESSEEEDDEKKTSGTKGEVTSILPSSVLDKASAIAQHFTNSIKRGSLAQDETSCLGRSSPRLLSRTNSSLSLSISLSAEPTDRPVQLNSICSDLAETDVSPQEDNLFDANQGVHRRRESTLSKQDQLLIGKIKNYYESAGNQNASFCLQRRESLTYIPTGLVSSSISRFNGFPKNEPARTNFSTSVTSSSLDPSSLESHSPFITGTGHMVQIDSLDVFMSEQRSTDPEDSERRHRPRAQEDNLSEEFRPSSEMIQIWQAMEQDLSAPQGKDEWLKEASRNSRAANINQEKSLNMSGDRESVSEDSTGISPLKPKNSAGNRTESLKNSLKLFGEETAALRAPVPRVAQLKAETEGQRPGDSQLDDVDTSKSKVLHLARQYSQRIKTTKPVVRQRSQGILISKSSLPCVMEEKETSGSVFVLWFVFSSSS